MLPSTPSSTSFTSIEPAFPESSSHQAVLICIQWRDWHNRHLLEQFTRILNTLIPQQGGIMLSANGTWFLAGFNLPDAVLFPAFLAVQTGLELLKILYQIQTEEQSLVLPGMCIERGDVHLISDSDLPAVHGELLEICQRMAQHGEEGMIIISPTIYQEIQSASLPFKLVTRSEIAGDEALPELKILKIALPTQTGTGKLTTTTLTEVVQTGDLHTQIIVAEDNPSLRAAFVKVLKSAGFRVKPAANGYEVVQYLNYGLPDVIVMDVGLPGYSGLELVRKIRDGQGDHYVFIIMVTGNPLAEQTPEADLADLFLLKPVSTRDLLDLVQRFMARASANQ